MIKKTDQWSALFLLLVAGLMCLAAGFLPYGNVHNPGPGFFPLWLGIILGAMSVGLMIQVSGRNSGGRILHDLVAEKIRWGKVLSVILALILYGFLMDYIGFLIVTFLLLGFLLRAIEPQPWRTVISWAFLGAVGSYLVFEVWMKLRLPKGILGGLGI